MTAPAGWHTVTPRIVVEDRAGFLAFLERVFGASVQVHGDAPALVMIGDSRIMVSGAGAREIFPAFLYIYVDDPEAACRRAVDSGASLMEAVWNTPYGDRRGMVRDPWGNVWQIAAPAINARV
jgi:PhnB protein